MLGTGERRVRGDNGGSGRGIYKEKPPLPLYIYKENPPLPVYIYKENTSLPLYI